MQERQAYRKDTQKERLAEKTKRKAYRKDKQKRGLQERQIERKAYRRDKQKERPAGKTESKAYRKDRKKGLQKRQTERGLQERQIERNRGRTYAKKLRFLREKRAGYANLKMPCVYCTQKTVTSHIKMRLVFSFFAPSREGL